MDEVHKLEASSPQVGGLIIKRSSDKKDDVFKVPKYGLDLLAKKLKKERENSSLLSFRSNDDDENDNQNSESADSRPNLTSVVTKNYRSSNVESTPGASASDTVKKYYENKKSDEKHKGLYSSSKKKDDRDRHRRKDDKSDRRRHRDSDRRSDRSDRRDHSDRRSRRRSPETPRQYNSDGGRIRSNWNDDDEEYPDRKKSRSAWDCPTPNVYNRHRSEDRSARSSSGYGTQRSRSRRNESETPRPTPAYKYNKWATDRRESGATPKVDGKSSDNKKPWDDDDEDREAWEEEQKRLDREWYNMDDGFDEEVLNDSSEYLKKREEANEAKRKKKMSAQQRQINKDNELWEKNRMITSGVVTSINVNEDFEEESVERVHLLVHHTIPPFLDGRIVFTKVMGKFHVICIS